MPFGLLVLSVYLFSIFSGHSYFLSDSKAVLQGCTDQWTLQENQNIPKLIQVTVCVDVRLMTAGTWIAFSYTSPRSPRYDLALQGDGDAVYAWLLGVQHRFPVQLQLEHWHRLCLRMDSSRNNFSLSVSSSLETHERTVIAHAIQPNGKLQLGCQPSKVSPGTNMATVELYLFRMWADVRKHELCEDGTIVGWDSSMWGISRAQSLVRDDTLYCGESCFNTQSTGLECNVFWKGLLRKMQIIFIRKNSF